MSKHVFMLAAWLYMSVTLFTKFVQTEISQKLLDVLQLLFLQTFYM